MAEIENINESWNNHGFPEVENFIKGQLRTSGKKVALESSGSRFRVNLLDEDDNVLSNSNYISTTAENTMALSFIDANQYVKLGDQISVQYFYLCLKTIYLYFKIRPKVIITTGTHTCRSNVYFRKNIWQ